MPEVVFSTPARRDYQNLDRQIRLRIDEKIAQLVADPLSPSQSKLLVGQAGLRAARVGDWRILFLPRDNSIIVVRIRHRREVYDNL